MKQLTDEELKQQYGIHMTSRIQEDGGGGTEAKWADIEEDEDDWTPEAIEWTDGTKSTLTNNEPTNNETAPSLPTLQENEPPKEPKDISLPTTQQDIREPPSEEKKTLPKQTTTIGPNPTILRLGAGTDRQAKNNATVTPKLPGEKSTSRTASPAPTPAKSPWAPLPPVDKVSPVFPAVQAQGAPRAPSREPTVNDGGAAAPAHVPIVPREIAADDFHRSWREGSVGGPRELYNSRSGRYEPVGETKKGSWRSEQALHAPSVLHRQMHHETTSHAEGFHAHKPSVQDGGHWTRRRTSSSVSGRSGGFGRQISSGRSELHQGRHVNGTTDEIPAGDSPRSREGGHYPTWRTRSPSMADHAKGALAVAEDAGVESQRSEEDPVAMQERIMKEKRLEARRRRLELEEKEEAARRERIRQKLEALGPPPEKQKPKTWGVQEAGSNNNKAEAVPSTAHQPPRPPVPEPTGEPKQYGMMKVYHPDKVKKLVAVNEREKAAERPAPANNTRRALSPVPQESVPEPAAGLVAGGAKQASGPHVPSPERHTEPRVGTEESPAWKGGNFGGISGYSPWTTPSAAKFGPVSSPIINPWKPLSNDRTLGNGIFDQPLGGFPPRDLPLRGPLGLDQSTLGPHIGPQQPFPSAASRPPTAPSQEATAVATLPSPQMKHVNLIARPSPIGPPSSQNAHWQQQAQDMHRVQSSAWKNFHPVAHKSEAEENEQLLREVNAARDEPSPLPVNFSEPWRQVQVGDHRSITVVGRASDTDSSELLAAPPNLLSGIDHPIGVLPFPDSHARPFPAVAMRGSRFFPPLVEAQPPRRPPVIFDDHKQRDGSRSPPPPEEFDHPAFSGYSRRPLVHLPAPKPVVKLPPKVAAAPPAPSPPPPTFASMAAARPPPSASPAPPSRTNAQHPVSAASIWQEKINGLFGKKPSEKRGPTTSLAVAPASREPLDDVQLHTSEVSVSLPQIIDSGGGSGSGDDVKSTNNQEATSRQVEEEEDLFEDREAGSLPVVRVPDMAPPAAWVAAQPRLGSRVRSKNSKAMQVQSIDPYFVPYDKDQSGNILAFIRLPSSAAAKSVVLRKKGGGGNSRQRGSNFNKARKNHQQHARSREGSGNFRNKKSLSFEQVNGNGSW